MKFLKTATFIAILSLISKFMGLGREIFTAYRFGTGAQMDSYVAARTATIILMGTLGAALNSSVMPVLSDIEINKGRKQKYIFFNRMVNLLLLLSVIIVLISIIFAPVLIKIIAWKFDPERHQMAVNLTRIGMPLVIFLGLNYLSTAFLQQSMIFLPSAASGIPYNIVFYIYLFFFTSGDINHLMIATVIAVFFQFAILIPSMKKLKYKFIPDRKMIDGNVVKIMHMIMPILIGSSVEQINTIIDRTLSSGLQLGAVSALSYASRVNDVVISVFIAAITTIIFPMLSEAFVKEEREKVKNIIKDGLSIIMMITIPATIGLMTLSDPFVRLIFERGEFDTTSTLMTSGALFMYSIGLTGIGARLLLNKAFYSLGDTTTPMKNGVVAVVINVITSVILVRFLGLGGIALGTSISALYSATALLYLLRKKIGSLGLKDILLEFIKFLSAGIMMGVSTWLFYYYLSPMLNIKETFALILSVLIAVIIYFILIIIFRVNTFRKLIHSIRYKEML